MKKLIVLLFLLFDILSSLFSAQYFMEQMDGCFNVNLASTKYVRHNDKATWQSGDAQEGNKNYGGYYNNQIICVVGVEGSSEETEVTFTFTGQDWYYILNGTDTRYKRPFGIDLVVRANHKTITDIIHLGRQANSSSNGVITASMKLPKTDGSEYNGDKIYSAWLDVILVMDPFVNKETGLINNGSDITDTNNNYYGYVVSSDNIYTSSFNVQIGGHNGQSYMMNLNGYYKGGSNISTSNDSFSSIMTVNPNANATSFDIKNLKPSNDSASNETVIADYNFTTNSVRSNSSSYNAKATAYFFASSSSLGAVKGDEFTLKYVSPISNATINNTNRFNSVTYEIGIKGSTGDVRWFSGKDNYQSIQSDVSKGLKAQTVVEKGSNSGFNIVRVYDEGQILLRIKGNVDDLSAGRYRSDVYFHVVTDY